jgi:hypothetical protein
LAARLRKVTVLKTISTVAESSKEGSRRAVLPKMMMLKKLVNRVWNGLDWLMAGKSGELFRTLQ